MKKIKDPGLEHIKKLNIRAVRDPKDIFNELTGRYGKSRAREIIDGIYGSLVRDGQVAMYDQKNADYEISMLISGGYDADIVRRACNWVSDNKDAFGDEILEVGCDCGFMTAFLGTVFPEKRITAVERSAAGIEIAKKNTEKFALSNIEFINADAADITDRKFDTVFSMRAMLENGIPEKKDDQFDEFAVLTENMANVKQSYASVLSGLVKDGGNVISIERLGRDVLFAAWLKALTNAGLKIIPDSYKEIRCTEAGKDQPLDAMIFEKADASDVDAFAVFMEFCGADIDTGDAQYEGMNAKIMYEFTGGRLIEGYEIRNTETGADSRMAARYHKDDDECILWYTNNNGTVRLEYYDASHEAVILDAVSDGLKSTEALDYMEITRLSE